MNIDTILVFAINISTTGRTLINNQALSPFLLT